MKEKDGISKDELKVYRVFIRCTHWQLDAINAAVKRVNKNKTAFLLDTVMRETREVLTPEVFRSFEMRKL